MTSTRYLIRPASEADLEAIVGYEIEIAVISFGPEAITDPALHRKRVTGALGKAGETTVVAVAPEAPEEPLGWAWLSARTNSLTGERYVNFRSLAVSDVRQTGPCPAQRGCNDRAARRKAKAGRP